MAARISTEEEEIKFHLKELKKHIQKGWGKPCPDFSPLCGNCIIRRAWETMNEIFKLTNGNNLP